MQRQEIDTLSLAYSKEVTLSMLFTPDSEIAYYDQSKHPSGAISLKDFKPLRPANILKVSDRYVLAL
ncbi:MAG: hypothetical protein AAGF77_11125, partial [Bacteroidota bacterium]